MRASCRASTAYPSTEGENSRPWKQPTASLRPGGIRDLQQFLTPQKIELDWATGEWEVGWGGMVGSCLHAEGRLCKSLFPPQRKWRISTPASSTRWLSVSVFVLLSSIDCIEHFSSLGRSRSFCSLSISCYRPSCHPRVKYGWHEKGREGRADQSHTGLFASDMYLRSSASLIRQATRLLLPASASNCQSYRMPGTSPGPFNSFAICTLLLP